MSIYERKNVDRFLDNFKDDLDGLFYFFAKLDHGQLTPVRVLHLARDFDQLSPWEKCVVMYELRDLAAAEQARLTTFYTRNARLAEDEGWG